MCSTPTSSDGDATSVRVATSGVDPGLVREEDAALKEADLETRIQALVGESDRLVDERAHLRDRLMEPLEMRRRNFDSLAQGWLRSLIRPRMDALARSFQNARRAASSEMSLREGLHFDHCEEFPAHAQIEVSIGHDREIERAVVRCTPSIIPILTDYQAETSVWVPLQAPRVDLIGEFLDAAILCFVTDFLTLRDPDSRYQKERLATDPVCGMVFRRVEATGTSIFNGRELWFCSSMCKERFDGAPERYIGSSRDNAKGAESMNFESDGGSHRSESPIGA